MFDILKGFRFLKRKQKNKSYDMQTVRLNDLLNFLGIDPSEDRLSEVTYFTCLKVLSEGLSKLPLALQRVSEDGGIIDMISSPLWQTAKIRPNPYMSPSTFWAVMENNRNHYGNGYAMILRDEKSGSVTLWPMEPSCIRIDIEQGKDLSELTDITYVYTSPNNGQSFRLRSDEVLHVKSSTVFFGLVGLSVQDKLKMSLDGAAMSQEMLNKLYRNNFVPKAAVQFDVGSMVNEEYESAYLKTLQNYADGKGEGGSSFIPLSPGTNIVPLNIKLTDGQFLELRKYSALQIAAAFGIKPNHLNDYEKSSYANSESQQLAFYTDTMLYILKQYEEELNYKLLSQAQREEGYRFKFNIAAVLRGDTKTQLESLSMGVSNGVYTPNEARRNLDLPARPGGDRIYFNGSNIAVEDAGIQYREQEQSDNAKAFIKLAESIEKAVECGIINITKYSDSQPRDDHGRWTDGGGDSGSGSSGGSSSESGISGKHDSKNSHNTVDLEYLKSEEYKNKFKGITGDTKVDEQLYKQSKAMLTHRNGTDKEDMCLINSNTGEIEGRQSNSKSDFGVDYNNSLRDAINNNAPYSLISIYNHPTNNPPTGSDLVCNGLHKYKLGLVVTHDGRVFTYKAGKIPFSAESFGARVEKYRKLEYNEFDAIVKTLSDYTTKYGIEWSER